MLIIGGAGGVGDALAMRLAGQRPVRVLTDGSSLSDSDDLGQLGIESLHGSLDDRASLDQALRGVETLFVMLDQTDAGPSGRRRRGEAIGDAAKLAGVRHVVYSASGPRPSPAGLRPVKADRRPSSRSACL